MSIALWAVIATCLVSELAFGSPVAETKSIPRGKRDVMSMSDYLTSFGYIDKDAMSVSNLRSAEDLEIALKTLQKIGHIPETGKMDPATVALMKKPRCGMPDTDAEEGARRKRYALGETKWDHKELTWNLDGRTVPRHLLRDDLRRDVRRALEVWARDSSLSFLERDGDRDADIQISFGARSHGDKHAFDGKGMVLAHAFAPEALNKIGGDTHFDAEEEWTLEFKHREGTHFFMVALHEFGHSLGLRHSDVMPSVMSPWYSGTDNSMLERDDIVAIQSLYGRGEPKGRGREPAREGTYVKTRDRDSYQPPPSYPVPAPREPPRERPSYPAPAPNYPPREQPRERPSNPAASPNYPPNYTPRREPPRERPNYLPSYPMNPPQRPAPRDPSGERNPDRQRPTNDPQRPDQRAPQRQPPHPEHRPVPPQAHPTAAAATTDPNSPEACDISYDAASLLRGELFIFKDDLFWRVRVPAFEERRDPPSLRKQFWKELPSGSVDAVYERPSGEIVFFVGPHYFVFYGTKLQDGPLPLTHLGLPRHLNKIDAVTRWKQHTYLFAGTSYWRFDEGSKRVASGYPREIADGWTGLDRDIDAALQWKDESTYFFKGKHFGKFDNERMRVEDMSRPAGAFWMNCKSAASTAMHAATAASVLLPLILHGFRYL